MPRPCLTHVPRSRFAPLLLLGWLAMPGLVFAANDTAIKLENVSGSNTAFVRVPNHAAFALQAFTLEAWVQRVGPGLGFSTDPSGAAIIAKPREGASGSNIASWHLHWTNSGQIHFNLVHTFSSSGVYILSSATPTPLARHHLAVTFDGATIRLYIDGVASGSASWTLGTVYYSTDDVLIGADNFDFGYLRRFDGYIDDVRVWNYARSASDIATWKDCRLAGSEGGLVAYWPFDDATLTDATGHGHDGLINGLPASASYAPLAALNDCAVGVGDEMAADVGLELRLDANPSSGRASLAFTLPRAAEARVALYDLGGQMIRVLAEGPQGAGVHPLTWDGRTDAGVAAPAGMYFVSARSEGWGVTKRLILMR
jgi:hypothetical protein